MKKLLLALFLFAAVTPAAAQGTIGAQPLLCTSIDAHGPLAAGTTQIIAGATGKIISICGWEWDELANGTIQLVFGTGATCTTPTSVTSNYTTLVNGYVINHIPNAFVSGLPGQSLCAIVTGTGSVISVDTYYIMTP